MQDTSQVVPSRNTAKNQNISGSLDTLEIQTNDPFRLFMKVFDQWEKEQKVPFTWETIITALDTLGEKKTAADIREWLKTQTAD